MAGGWLLAHYWWGSVFLINVPIAFTGLVATAWLVPNSRNPHSARPDPVGGLLSIVGMTLLLWGIIEAPRRPWTSPLVIGALVLAAGVLTGFALWEHRSRHPMLRLELFRSRRFSGAMLGMAFVIFALIGGLFILTQYLQFSLGYSALGARLRVAPLAVLTGAVVVAVAVLMVLLLLPAREEPERKASDPGRSGGSPVAAGEPMRVLIAGSNPKTPTR